MNSRAWAADLLHLAVVHLTNAVSEWTGSVDDALCLHVPLLLGQVVAQCGSAQGLLAVSALLLVKLQDFNVVGDCRTVASSCESNGQAHTSVVLLSVVVDDGATQVVLLQHGETFKCVLLRQVVTRLDVAISSHEIVGLDTDPEVWHLPPPAEKFIRLAAR